METATSTSCMKIFGPAFRSCATRLSLWWMQDGTPSQCTTAAQEFLLNKFGGRIISRGTQIAWPAHSPDLNSLDFFIGP